MKNKHTLYAPLLIVFTIIYAAAFYMLSAQTQFYIDDYCYVFRHAPDHLKHIPGYEAFSFYTDHFAGVSRFVPHLFVWAAHYAGKGLFDIVATASFSSACRVDSGPDAPSAAAFFRSLCFRQRLCGSSCPDFSKDFYG